METETISQTYFFEDIEPDEVYDTYMNTNRHFAFTGTECEISTEIGGTCTMYDGYIVAENIRLEPGKLIEQSWTAKEEGWPEGHLSYIKIELEAQKEGTQLTLEHREVPKALKDSLDKGWKEYYWEPMETYF